MYLLVWKQMEIFLVRKLRLHFCLSDKKDIQKRHKYAHMHPYQHPYPHIPICTCTENINAGSVCFAFSWGWVACSYVFYVLYYSINTLLCTADICYTSWVLHTYTHTCMLLNFVPNVLNENFIVRKLLWKVLLVLWLTSLEKHCSNSHGATLFSIF